ncbi:MAG: LamG domain-containing protein, partial [Opitutaceae bacterium]|nr:LamG domain-containing protein [Opitutaceae bacterium]
MNSHKKNTSQLRKLAGISIHAAATAIAHAEDVTVPLPSIQWNPTESGTTIPNTGTKDGFTSLTNDTLLLKKTTDSTVSASAFADLITIQEGSGPFNIGRAIDFSSNAKNGGFPTTNPDPALASPVARIESGFDLVGTSTFTFTLWYKLDSDIADPDGGATTLLRATNFLNLFFLKDGSAYKLRFAVTGDAPSPTGKDHLQVDSSTLTQRDKWVFIAGTWNGANGTATLYCGTEEMAVNKLAEDTMKARGAFPANTALNVAFHNTGQSGSGNGRTFDGWLADIRFYSHTLTAAQIEKIRSGSSSPVVTTYLPAVKSWADTSLGSNFTDAKIDAGTASPTPSNGFTDDDLFHAAAVAARLWILGGKTNAAYADKAFYILNALRTQRSISAKFSIGFQARYSFAEAYGILLENGYTNAAFDAAFKADMKDMARDSLGPGDTSDNNVGAFMAAGTVRALTLWPDLDAGGAWTDYIKQQWASWAGRHDT